MVGGTATSPLCWPMNTFRCCSVHSSFTLAISQSLFFIHHQSSYSFVCSAQQHRQHATFLYPSVLFACLSTCICAFQKAIIGSARYSEPTHHLELVVKCHSESVRSRFRPRHCERKKVKGTTECNGHGDTAFIMTLMSTSRRLGRGAGHVDARILGHCRGPPFLPAAQHAGL